MSFATEQCEKNDVCAALTLTYQPGKFHWSLYIVEDPKSGWKMHATDAYSPTWEFKCEQWNGMEDTLGFVFVRIGKIDEGLDYQSILEYVKGIPMEVPGDQRRREERFTCRVWFKEVIRVLNEAEMFVQCDDVDALEEELKQRALALEGQKRRSANDFKPVVSGSYIAGAWPDPVLHQSV